MKKEGRGGLRTWIEIDTKALKRNFKTFRKAVPKNILIGAVVKSNAYGHDLYQFSKAADKLGADWIIVDSIVEALALRKEKIKKPILVLGYTLPGRMPEAINHGISLTVSSIKNLETALAAAKKSGKNAKVHIKIDTGLSRQGFLPGDMKEVIDILKHAAKWVWAEGLYTHFSAAKNPSFPESVDVQLEKFRVWTTEFEKHGFRPIIHAAATSAALLFPKTHFDMVRVGIGLYGLWPSMETKRALEGKIKLEPILSWKTIVSEVKTLPKGTRVGYDGTGRLAKDSKLAVCPIGYWHGFNRRLSGIGYVLIGGKRAKIVGRVSMDMIVVDVSEIPSAKEGSEAVIIGRQGKEEANVYEMAALAGTSWYETIVSINPLIKRLYI